MFIGHNESRITVIADNTDVFALSVYHDLDQNLPCPMIMQSLIIQLSLYIDIPATIRKHDEISSQIPLFHAVSGGDAAASTFGFEIVNQ